jgi:NADPH-dependent glutamate synthase beta subunit-like oxidoreductase
MAYTPPMERPIEREMHPPCNVACPVGNDIEGFVQLIQRGKWDDALNLMRDTNPLPGITGRVCDSPCQKACNRGRFDQSVSIKALERALADYAADKHKEAIAVTPKYKVRVAIIGSGPAGLSCAYHLTRNGFRVTVFDEKPEIGGILRYGIPPYRIPNAVLDREVTFIQKLGIDFELNRKLGADLSMKDLENYDAMYMAIGFHRTKVLGILGEDCPQVIPGLDFLEQVNGGKSPELGRHVLIMGGGNSAVHAARAALRLGAKPTLVFNRRQNDMAAISSQRKELKSEGIEILPLTTPVHVNLKDGRLTGVTCAKTEMIKEETDGRKRPVPVSGSEFIVPADTIINGMGETGDLDGAPLELKVEGDKIAADRWGRTSMPNGAAPPCQRYLPEETSPRVGALWPTPSVQAEGELRPLPPTCSATPAWRSRLRNVSFLPLR